MSGPGGTPGGPLRPTWRREGLRFMLAVQLLTRLPVPASLPWHPADALASVRYLPGVGALVGALCGAVLCLALLGWSPAVAVGLSIAVGVLLTGGLHEDGLADSCDGLGGGRDREMALRIFKDSRVGSYGVLGLLLALGLKTALWLDLLEQLGGLAQWPLLLSLSVFAHATSRAAPLWIMLTLDDARHQADGLNDGAIGVIGGVTSSAKSAAFTHQRPSAWSGGVALLQTGAAAALPWACGWSGTNLVLAGAAVALVALWAQAGLRRRLGGHVGDTLGAVQQVAELACLLVLAALWTDSSATAHVGF